MSSGGQINLENERIILEPTGNFDDIEDIRNTLIPVGNGSQLIYLGDICTVTKGYIDPPTQKVRINGRDAITFHINLKRRRQRHCTGRGSRPGYRGVDG